MSDVTKPLRAARQERAAKRAALLAQREGEPTTAFASFLERDAQRAARLRRRRRTWLISVAVHGVLIAAVLLYSVFKVEELWSPVVEVKVFSPSQLPPGVNRDPFEGAPAARPPARAVASPPAAPAPR